MPLFQPHSIHTMNGFQSSYVMLSPDILDNAMEMKPPLPSNVISAESIIDKHIIQTCG